MKSGIKRKKLPTTTKPSAKLDLTLLTMGGAWEDGLPQAAALVRRACKLVLDESDLVDVNGVIELAVVLTDDEYIRDLNHTYRGKNKPTNVLSFPAVQNAVSAMKIAARRGMPLMLGDIVLAYEAIEREAAQQDKSMQDHLTHLVVHGCLHILGFDHEEPHEAEIMEQLEKELLAKIGIADPYHHHQLQD